MTEVPEHLLRRSRERREALGAAPSGGGGGGEGGADASPPAGDDDGDLRTHEMRLPITGRRKSRRAREG